MVSFRAWPLNGYLIAPASHLRGFHGPHRPEWSINTYKRSISPIFLLTALLITIGLVIFPLGFDQREVRDACGLSDKYRLGQSICGISPVQTILGSEKPFRRRDVCYSCTTWCAANVPTLLQVLVGYIGVILFLLDLVRRSFFFF